MSLTGDFAGLRVFLIVAVSDERLCAPDGLFRCHHCACHAALIAPVVGQATAVAAAGDDRRDVGGTPAEAVAETARWKQREFHDIVLKEFPSVLTIFKI